MKKIKSMLAVIIEGNPAYIVGNPLAVKYYQEIEDFLKANGVSKVIRDPGNDYTCPPKADIYIGHSRGAGRFRCMSKKDQFRFLRFGDLNGYIHPDDAEWQMKVFKKGVISEPPACHYEFIPSQRKAIVDLIATLNETNS